VNYSVLILKVFLLIFSSFILITNPVQANERNLKQTVNELRSQVEVLTERLLQMEKRLDHVDSLSSKQTVVSNRKSKKAGIDSVKQMIKIPSTDTSLAFGGYIKLDAIYNSQSVGGNGGSNLGDQMVLPGLIPIEEKSQEDDQITFHARQSRFWLKSHTATGWGDLDTYIEMDFFAFQSPGNERVSNSYSPRLRHAFGHLGGFLAGQTWTTFMNVKALPELNDFGGPVGRVFSRQPQVRWTQAFNDGQSDWMIAVEEPESTLTNSHGEREAPDDDYFPDIITRFNFHRSWGEVSVAGMVRNIRSDQENVSDAYGGALSLAGRINSIERDDLRFMLNYGNVLGRYVSSNLFNDGAVNANGSIELFNQYGGFIAYRHWWNNDWRSTMAYGLSYADNVDFVPKTVNQWAQSAQINLLWSPLAQTTLGLEYTYASRGLENGDSGHIHRLQFSSAFHF